MFIFDASCRVRAHVQLMRKFKVIVEFNRLLTFPVIVKPFQLDAEVRWQLANTETLLRVTIKEKNLYNKLIITYQQ